MRIARPILLVTTPLGVALGLYEAWRFGPGLAVLMALLLGVITGFFWMTWRRIRLELRESNASDPPSRPDRRSDSR